MNLVEQNDANTSLLTSLPTNVRTNPKDLQEQKTRTKKGPPQNHGLTGVVKKWSCYIPEGSIDNLWKKVRVLFLPFHWKSFHWNDIRLKSCECFVRQISVEVNNTILFAPFCLLVWFGSLSLCSCDVFRALIKIPCLLIVLLECEPGICWNLWTAPDVPVRVNLAKHHPSKLHRACVTCCYAVSFEAKIMLSWKGTPGKGAARPENVENVRIFYSAGFIRLFNQCLCSRSTHCFEF